MFLRKPFKYSFFNVTLILIAMNIVIYALQKIGVVFTIGRVKIDVTNLFAANYTLMRMFGFWWQPFTYMFVHGSVSHILFNMLALLFFGISVEKAIGSKEFLLFYIFCGVADGIISIMIYWNMQMPVTLMGASGAIYALLFMYAVIFPRNRIYIWGIIPIRAPFLVLIYAAIAFFSQILDSNAGTAHVCHLMGFVIAWIYMFVRMGVHPLRIWKNTL